MSEVSKPTLTYFNFAARGEVSKQSEGAQKKKKKQREREKR